MKTIIYTSALALILGIASVQASETVERAFTNLPKELHGEVNKHLTALSVQKQFENPRTFTNDINAFLDYMKKAAELHVDKVGPVTLVAYHGGVPTDKLVPYFSMINELNLSVYSGIDTNKVRILMQAALKENAQIKVKIDAYFMNTWTTPGTKIKMPSIQVDDQKVLLQEFSGHLTFGDV